jgi:rRNA large subunit m3Psi methyltransferase RlmH
VRTRVIAVGTRMPRWVTAAFEEYTGRLTPALRPALVQIDTAKRGAQGGPQAFEAEGERLLAALRRDEFVVALDERGRQLTTRELAAFLKERMQDGRDLAFVIGGPDGLAPGVLARADLTWSLSRLTFPHALVRVILAEQLYRAHSILTNHPYHRE